MTTIEQIDTAVRRALSYPPEVRLRMIEPLMAFFESVERLREGQDLHLITLKEYHATLQDLVDLTAAPPAPRVDGLWAGVEDTTADLEFIDGLAEKEIRHGRGASKEERVRIARGFQALMRGRAELRAALTPAAQRVEGGDELREALESTLTRIYDRALEQERYWKEQGSRFVLAVSFRRGIRHAIEEIREALPPASSAGPDKDGEG